jgi:hypothetical protein
LIFNLGFKIKDLTPSFPVLRDLGERYDRLWRRALADAPGDTRGRIRALVLADLDPAVLNLETLGVWYAFRAQARVDPLFVELNRETDCDHVPGNVTRGLIAMLEHSQGHTLSLHVRSKSRIERKYPVVSVPGVRRQKCVSQ